MEDEGVLFEGLRLGSTQAFEELVAADDAGMRRLARLYVTEEQVAPLVRQAWSVALPGLDMFTWHTTLRAWLTGILVTYGRSRRAPPPVTTAFPRPGAPPTPAAVRTTASGTPGRTPAALATAAPLPWSSLAWSGLWTPEGWDVLEAALRARPLPEQEVLWLHDVEGWSWREVLDALGMVAEEGAHHLHQGRTALATAVAGHVGRDADATVGDDERQRHEGVATLLSALRPRRHDTSADPELLRAFVAWRRRRGARAWPRWRWELGRAGLRPARAAEPSGRPHGSRMDR